MQRLEITVHEHHIALVSQINRSYGLIPGAANEDARMDLCCRVVRDIGFLVSLTNLLEPRPRRGDVYWFTNDGESDLNLPLGQEEYQRLKASTEVSGWRVACRVIRFSLHMLPCA